MLNYNQVKLTDKKNAFAYAVYMMVSSNFREAFCDSQITEEWLHFQFRQQKSDTQDKMADMCAAYADDYLMEVLPEHIWKERVYVVLDRDYCGIRSIFLEGTDFSMNIQSYCQNQSRATITCRFEYLGETTEYVTVVKELEEGKFSFRELGSTAKRGKAGKPAISRKKSETASAQTQHDAEAEQYARIRSMLARALEEGILEIPESASRRAAQAGSSRMPEHAGSKEGSAGTHEESGHHRFPDGQPEGPGSFRRAG